MKLRNQYIAIAVSVLILAALVYYFTHIVSYVLIAWILSMVGQPLMRFFQSKLKVGKFKVGPNIAAVLTLLVYFVLSVTLVWLFVPLIIDQTRNLGSVDFSDFILTLEVPLNQMSNWLVEIGLVEQSEAPSEQIQNAFRKWFQWDRIGTFFSSIFSMAGNLLFTVFSVVFITFFFLKEQGLFVDFLTAIAPREYEDHVKKSIDSISKLLTRYFAGVLLQITVITVFVSVFLGLLGIKNALLIGFFAGLINVIPYLGPIMGAAFGIFVTISSNIGIDFYSEMAPLLLKVAGVFGAMQMLDNFFLQPYIFSNSVLAHPLEIFIVVLMGAQVGGIKGMVLAIPSYTVLRVMARVFLSEFNIVKRLVSGIEDEVP